MTGIDSVPADGPMEPPWPVDVLADLHAGALDTAVARQLWPLVRQDPDARSTLAALDTTRAELAALATSPAPPMPAHLATRLDAALAAEAGARMAPVLDLARARKKRNQRGWVAGVLVAAAAAAVAVVTIPRGTGTSTDAVGTPVTSLNSATLTAALGRSDYGPLADPGRRAACLAANQQDPNQTPAGAMQVTLAGKPGVLLVLTTGKLAQYRVLVVGPDCATGHPDRLAEAVIGGGTVPTR
ncbi:MAG TPA: hypothetical protein VGL06_18190 [Pseudonocardiaceae bacterium]